MLRHPPDSEYWTRFITKRSQNPAKRRYNPGFYNPSEYLGTNPDPKSENEYWTRFVTKRSGTDKAGQDYWTRFVKRDNTQVLLAEVFYNVKNGSSFITSKSLSENLSNQNKHF